MLAVMAHRVALRERPAASRSKISGSAISRIIHRPIFQNIIFRAQSQSPKKIKKKSGIFRSYFYIPIACFFQEAADWFRLCPLGSRTLNQIFAGL